MGRTIWPAVLFFLLIPWTGGERAAWSYIQTVTPNGLPVHWNRGFKFNLAGNPTNSSGLNPSDFFQAVARSLQRWESASEGAVSFDYWQGTNDNIYEPDSNYNGLSSLYFATHAGGAGAVSSNVLGLTQVWYNADSGQILEADTVLNDRDFAFSTDPRDTSGYGAGGSSFSSGRTRVYIENVLTHEFGHSFGLSHSAGLQSTMLFMESPEQAHLGCDEQVGIHALYPSSDAGARGWMSGVVTGPTGPIFGAHVLAISRERGGVLSSGITDRSGTFSISGLEPGPYYLIAEPYLAGAAALPSYYGPLDDQVCADGSTFHRTVLTDSSGHIPIAVNVPAGGRGTVPTLQVNCSAQAPVSGIPTINGNDPTGFGVVDRFGSANQASYKLSQISGHLDVHGIAYSVYSPVHASLSLQDSAGHAVTAQSSDQVYSGDSGYVNFDTELVADNLPLGDYLLVASVTSIGVTYYPAGPIMLDSDPFLLIAGNVNGSAPALSDIIPTNARCRMDESFAAYQSPPGDPPRAETESGGGGVGFCSTTRSTSGGTGPGAGTGAAEIAGWFLPWLLMAGIGRRAVRASRRAARKPVLS